MYTFIRMFTDTISHVLDFKRCLHSKHKIHYKNHTLQCKPELNHKCTVCKYKCTWLIKISIQYARGCIHEYLPMYMYVINEYTNSHIIFLFSKFIRHFSTEEDYVWTHSCNHFLSAHWNSFLCKCTCTSI